MENKELRLGNYLMGKNGLVVVSEIISENRVRILNNKSSFTVGICLDPIPLTEEWFLKLGGYEYPNRKGVLYLGSIRYVVSSNRIEVAVAGPGHDGCDIWDDEFKHIDSVHMLQNLYFFLENEELTINE